jgi:tetratricopeptide (TPR) repeat protein
MLLETVKPQNLLDYPNSLKYADYLFQTNQYNLAAVEFERVVFQQPEDTLAKLKLIRSYRYLHEYKTALQRLENYFPDSLKDLPEEFSGEFVKNLLYENQFQKAYGFLQNNTKLNKRVKAEYQLGIFIMQHQWNEARHFAEEHIGILENSEKYNGLNSVIIKGMNTNYKKPFLAATFSVIVPGAGKVYSGQWKDAIYSFLFVTTSSWLTYKSYKKNGFSLNSVLIGSFAISFYSANIYGSVKSAKKFNQNANQSFRRKTEDILLSDQ